MILFVGSRMGNNQASTPARPFGFPTTKGVAHIGTSSVELSEESTSRIISTFQKK